MKKTIQYSNVVIKLSDLKKKLLGKIIFNQNVKYRNTNMIKSINKTQNIKNKIYL